LSFREFLTPEAQFPRSPFVGNSLTLQEGPDQGRIDVSYGSNEIPGPSAKKIIVSHPPLLFAAPKV
jgi:hypothetical protein